MILKNIRNWFSENLDVSPKKCKICDKLFDLQKENKYIAVESAGVTSAFNGTKKYECFDCPHCGCQNIVNEYKEKEHPKLCSK